MDLFLQKQWFVRELICCLSDRTSLEDDLPKGSRKSALTSENITKMQYMALESRRLTEKVLVEA